MRYYISETTFDNLIALAEILQDDRLDSIIEQIESSDTNE